MELKNIKDFTKAWKEDLRRSVLPGTKLVYFRAEGDAATKYEDGLRRDCESLGIEFESCDPSAKNMLTKVKGTRDAIVFAQPLPEWVKKSELKGLLPGASDVDGLLSWRRCATAIGVIKYLEYCGFEFDGANVVVIGRGRVGKPIARMLEERNCTVTLCHSHTGKTDLRYYEKNADLVVCAVGQAKFLSCTKIKCPVIDVGINFVRNRLVGDCYNVGPNVTPVPGGVGLLTRCALLENIVKSKRYFALTKK